MYEGNSTLSKHNKPFSLAKKICLTIFIIAIIVGCGTWYLHQQKAARHVQVEQAREAMITAQAEANNLSLLNTDQIRTLTAQAIGHDENSVSFHKVNLQNEKFKSAKKHSNQKGKNATEATTPEATSFHPVYAVNCHVNNIKYNLQIDAVTGKILQSDAS